MSRVKECFFNPLVSYSYYIIHRHTDSKINSRVYQTNASFTLNVITFPPKFTSKVQCATTGGDVSAVNGPVCLPLADPGFPRGHQTRRGGANFLFLFGIIFGETKTE